VGPALYLLSMLAKESKPLRSPYERPLTSKMATQRITMRQSKSAGTLTGLPMQRSRQGQSFPRTKRMSVSRSLRRSPGPAAYELNMDSTKRSATPKTMGIRYDGGSQCVSGIGFMGKEHRPGDITPGPGAYSFDSLYTNRRTHRVPKSKRFTKRHGIDPEPTPGPAVHVEPDRFGKVGSGGLLSSSMSSPSIGLKAHGKGYISKTPSPALYSPYDADRLGRFKPKTVFMSRKATKTIHVPGPGKYDPEPAQANSGNKAATLKFRRPVGRMMVSCGGGWLGRQQVPDPNTPGPQSYAITESKLSKNFASPPPLSANAAAM